MARRIIKPFAVEVRHGGRTIKGAPATAAPSMADLIRQVDQPHAAAWPGIDAEPAASSRTAERPPAPVVPAGRVTPTGRVLPVLSDPTSPDADEPAPPPLSGPHHWPAVPGLTIESSWPEDEKVVEELEELEVVAAGSEAEAPEVDVAASSVPRQGRARLPRDAFRRGERWKARLPAAMHRKHKREA